MWACRAIRLRKQRHRAKHVQVGILLAQGKKKAADGSLYQCQKP